jgi:hypothetical protein
MTKDQEVIRAKVGLLELAGRVAELVAIRRRRNLRVT